jgi:histidine triad (HIT) family protein
MNDCLFCSIANGDPDKWIWHNDVAVAINDINPKTPVHVLVMPKRHVKNIDELEDAVLAGQLLLAVRDVAHKVGLKGAWRVRVNNGRDVGQTVDHLHFHVMGGKQLAE